MKALVANASRPATSFRTCTSISKIAFVGMLASAVSSSSGGIMLLFFILPQRRGKVFVAVPLWWTHEETGSLLNVLSLPVFA